MKLLPDYLCLTPSSVAEGDAKGEKSRQGWSVLGADNIRLLAHSLPDGKRHIIHIQKTHLISGFASLAVDAQSCHEFRLV
jgi:hypothetical protein